MKKLSNIFIDFLKKHEALEDFKKAYDADKIHDISFRGYVYKYTETKAQAMGLIAGAFPWRRSKWMKLDAEWRKHLKKLK